MKAAYRDLAERYSLRPLENPVAKRPLGVTGVDAQLIVNLIGIDGDEGGDDENGGTGNFRVRAGLGKEEVRLLSSQVMHLRRELSDSRQESARRDHSTRNSLTRINRNVARLVCPPATAPQAK